MGRIRFSQHSSLRLPSALWLRLTGFGQERVQFQIWLLVEKLTSLETRKLEDSYNHHFFLTLQARSESPLLMIDINYQVFLESLKKPGHD